MANLKRSTKTKPAKIETVTAEEMRETANDAAVQEEEQQQDNVIEITATQAEPEAGEGDWPWSKEDPLEEASSYSQTSVYLNKYEKAVLKLLRERTFGSQAQYLRDIVKIGVRELAKQIEAGQIPLREK